jgi:hypothetical protein
MSTQPQEMQSQPLQITKSELLDRIHASRAALEQLINSLSEIQLTRRGPSGWAVKDHLAHLAAWELGIAELLQHGDRFGAMQLDEATVEGKSEDEINDLIYHRHVEQSLAEVKSLFQTAHDEMLRAIAVLEDVDLQRPYTAFLPEGSNGPDRPVYKWIIGNTFGHFDEHYEYIQELVQKE